MWISLSLLFSQFARNTNWENGGLWGVTICFVAFKILIGNDDKNSEVKHVLYGVLTRYLRIRPQTHQGGVCMRIEVFGVKQKPSEFEI